MTRFSLVLAGLLFLLTQDASAAVYGGNPPPALKTGAPGRPPLPPVRTLLVAPPGQWALWLLDFTLGENTNGSSVLQDIYGGDRTVHATITTPRR